MVKKVITYGIIILFLCCAGLTWYIMHQTLWLSMKPFYNNPDKKLWAHAQNDIDTALASKKTYTGLELDLFFVPQKNNFLVKHDTGSAPTEIWITDYLAKVADPAIYFWFDMKNLDRSNAPEMAACLDYILTKFQLKNQVIVESQFPEALNDFSVKSIYTSYWIPHFQYDKMRFYTRLRLAIEVGTTVRKNGINALSCRYDKFEFLDEFFPNANIHIWTSSIHGAASDEKIKTLKEKKNLKIILVDYASNPEK